MTDDARTTLIDLLHGFRFAMLTTVDGDGKHLAYPLTLKDREFDGDLWFVVSTSSHAAENLRSRPDVGVSLSSDSAWVSLSGTASFVDDPAKLDEVWDTGLEAWFPEGPKDPDVGLLKFEADSAEFWHSPGGRIATAVAYLRSRVTGERPNVGENDKLDL